MAETELAFSPLRVDLPELSLVPMELLDPGPGNLLPALADVQFGLESTTGLQLQMEDVLAHDDAMLIPQFGDADLAEWVGGLSNPSPLLDMNIHHQLEDKFYLIIGDEATAAKQTHSNHELDMVPMHGGWGGFGQRKCRTRSTSWKAAETSHLFGFLKPFASGHMKFGTRNNYSHWTYHEVEKLLNGVYEHGIENWAKVKITYFKTSPRTAEHLKDKWRGLCRACGLQVGSKQKVKAQPATLEILKGFRYKIRKIARKHA